MFLNFLTTGLIAGCSYALVALGFALIYSTTRVFHFAHGAIYIACAYLFYTFHDQLKIPLMIAAAIALVCVSLFAVVLDELVYLPLQKKSSSLLAPMISSIGLYIVIVNVIAIAYGNAPRILNPGVESTIRLGSIILTRIQVITALVFASICAVLYALLRYSPIGVLIRAVRDDADLVSVMGRNPRAVRRAVFFIGSCLAGIAAILSGLDVGFDPNVGIIALLNAAVAVIIGGVGSLPGVVVGALLLGSVQSMATMFFSAKWQNAASFGLLLVFLIFLPYGLFGKKRRIEEAAE